MIELHRNPPLYRVHHTPTKYIICVRNRVDSLPIPDVRTSEVGVVRKQFRGLERERNNQKFNGLTGKFTSTAAN